MTTGTSVLRRLTVPGRPEQIGAARRFVADALGECGPRAEVTVLLASELVTNSMQHSASGHSGGMITIALTVSAGSAATPRHGLS
jgi:two-component sensor histidine kinase